MTLPGKRALNLVGFLVCAGLMSFALYAQYVLVLDPCPLCVLQRVAVIALGLVFLLATLHDPLGWGSRVYALLVASCAAGGSVVAGRHVWLQNLPPDKVPSCGPGLGYLLENFPVGEAMSKIFTGSGECAEVVWQFLGLSMPAWVLVWLIFLAAFGIWNNLRR